MKYKVKYMNYELLNENQLLSEILTHRGVKDVSHFLHVSKDDVHDGMLFKNMKEGLDLFHKHIESKSKIRIIVDSDVDGYTSGALVFQYIKRINPEIEIDFIIHNGKTHGIKLEEFKDFNFDLLIVPDAGSNDVDSSKVLKNKGKDILILDHHNIDVENPYAIVINNQDAIYPNPTLAGVGVTYKFCKEYDKKYGYNYADNYLDLVAIGMVADDMDLSNYETRYLVLEGLKMARLEKGNEFLQEIYAKRENDIKEEVTITNIGWHIAPIINGMIRTGTMKEKTDMFRALIGEQEQIPYQPRRPAGTPKDAPKPPLEYHSLQKTMARIAMNVKGKQDRIVKKGVEALLENIKSNKLDDNKIIIVDGTDCLEQAYTGLVANKLAEQFKRPTLILKRQKDNPDYFGGSARNYSLFDLDDLNTFLTNTGLFEHCSGHNNAFGYSICSKNLEMLTKKTNKQLKDVEIEDVYHVDYSIPIGKLREKDILQVGEWNHIWGNNIEEPTFAITGLSVTTDSIQLIGAKGRLIKIEKVIGSRHFEFIILGNEEEYNKIVGKQKKGIKKKTSKRIDFDIICKFEINEYMGKKKPQLKVVDYNVKEAKKFNF